MNEPNQAQTDDRADFSPSYHAAAAGRVRAAVEQADRSVQDGQPADRWLAAHFRQNRALGSANRRLISNTVFSFFRWRGWLVTEPQPDYATATVLAHLLDSDTVHPALATEGGTDWVALGQADLATKARRLADWLGLAQPPAAECLLPGWALERLASLDGESVPGAGRLAMIEALQKRPPLWLRFPANAPAGALDALRQKGYPVEPHAALPGAASCARPISREFLHPAKGTPVEVQDLASQCVGWICRPQPGERWWDACAGGGGKTLQLADLLQGRGRIQATEPRAASLAQLEQRARRAGVHRLVRMRQADARTVEWPDGFDGVLLDAPCSGLGTWSRSPDARWRMTAETADTYPPLQAALLAQAARFVQPGGALVYAVCTLTADETVRQAEAFTAARPDFAPDDFEHPLTGARQAGTVWIHPWEGPCGGMFIARWRRLR